MTNSSASKQYVINQLPTSSGQIQTLTLAATLGTFGSTTIHYQKVGKLYFNIWAANGGGVNFFFGAGNTSLPNAQATMDEVASLLGVTVNTYYDSTNNGAYTGSYAAGTWSSNTGSGADRRIINAFLAN